LKVEILGITSPPEAAIFGKSILSDPLSCQAFIFVFLAIYTPF
jgi:hypothetical protein